MKIKLLVIIAVIVTVIIAGCATKHSIEYRIDVKTSPGEGGVMQGAGTYKEQEEVKLKAVSEEGFIFRGWEEDGKIISAEKKYVFVAKESRELTAVFKEKEEPEVFKERNEIAALNGKMISTAIDSGLEFLIKHPEKGNPWETYSVLGYLYRKFGLDERYAFKNTFDYKKYEDYINSSLERLTDPDFIAPLELIEKKNKLKWFMARALYSDYYPVDNDYIEKLFDYLGENIIKFEAADKNNSFSGYVITHVILCFRWMHELGYDIEEFGIEDPWEIFASYLVKIVEFDKAETDLAFEAIAFLYYIEQGHRVKDFWIETLLSCQLPDGSWSRVPGGKPDSHPTFLAVWALLEYYHPHAEPLPMIK